ncbi:aldolase/citrate lyase family protein [Sinisalibacter aestuarii]|uniref:2,4-dihydroxyhept-2-ene-1,7-dioic acid aldolase n=1 Tax=Sinisalibacter aestuarii TaxID=2949426 RepID=A0ABQ5LZM7_9RHOB|nr:aldolase/citrate lyase family protein [Sinisalibacter aestuarii]GKY90168.1 2,4-dihydroxyhept-2-ene-1,7-dioic acid aldolase [Sinisalibacter aestuarii]
MAALKHNAFKAGLREGRLQRGLWCTINDTLVAEMCAGLGFDWMLFDTEHSALDPLSVLPLLQAVAAYPVSPIVRPGSLNAAEIKKLLDIGAQNILVPMVQNADEAAAAVAAVEYPPAGIRGVSGLTRATAFAEIAGYHKAARAEIAVLVQVETLEAVGQIEAIAAVPGVDGIFVGPADLAAALGHVGEPSHPEVVEVSLDAVKRIVAAGKPAGFLSADEGFADRITEAGATFVSRDIDMAAMKRGLKDRLR